MSGASRKANQSECSEPFRPGLSCPCAAVAVDRYIRPRQQQRGRFFHRSLNVIIIIIISHHTVIVNHRSNVGRKGHHSRYFAFLGKGTGCGPAWGINTSLITSSLGLCTTEWLSAYPIPIMIKATTFSITQPHLKGERSSPTKYRFRKSFRSAPQQTFYQKSILQCASCVIIINYSPVQLTGSSASETSLENCNFAGC